MSLEQLVELAADVLISAGPLSADVADTLASTLRLDDSQSPLGPNDWWERRVAEPSPCCGTWPPRSGETFAQDAMLFLRNVATSPPGTKVPNDELAVACQDLDAPYVFLGTEIHCDDDARHDRATKPKAHALAAPWVLVASIAVVCVAYLLSRCPSKGPEADPPGTPKDRDSQSPSS